MERCSLMKTRPYLLYRWSFALLLSTLSKLLQNHNCFRKCNSLRKLAAFKLAHLFAFGTPRYTSSPRFLKGIKCNIIHSVKMTSTRDIMQDKHKNGWKIKIKLLGLKRKFSGVIKEMFFIQHFTVRNKTYSFLIQPCQRRFIQLI